MPAVAKSSTSQDLTVTDMFCGAGGSSIGVVTAGATLQLALNHWKRAIETHNSNFPSSDHVCTDIHACDPRRFRKTNILIASPECTQHTLAAGKKRKMTDQMDMWDVNFLEVHPDEERSRATMWDVVRFTEQHRYQAIIVENVVEAKAYWEPYKAWLAAMASIGKAEFGGYRYQEVFFNSMHAHPTPQSRDRMYVVFTQMGNPRPNLKITPEAWCVPCQKNVASVQVWKNRAKPYGKFGDRQQYIYCCPKCGQKVTPYYYCAANAIDWTDIGQRIGDRKRPLAPKTMKRIEAGLKKFGNKPSPLPFFWSMEHNQKNGEHPITDPMHTMTTAQSTAMVTPFLMMVNQTGDHRVRTVDDPYPTQTGDLHPAVVTPMASMIHLRNNQDASAPMTAPLHTVTASGGHHGVLMGPNGPHPFLVNLSRTKNEFGAVDKPMATVTTTEMHALVTPGGAQFIGSYYGGRDAVQGMDQPLPTQTAEPRHSLVTPPTSPFVLEMFGNATNGGMHEAMSTVTASGVRHAMVTPFVTSYGGKDGEDITDPLATVTSLSRHGLVTPEEINPEDCYFRMLTPKEVLAAMAFPGIGHPLFPDGYKVTGNQREQVKQAGNAVTPPVMTLLFQRVAASLASRTQETYAAPMMPSEKVLRAALKKAVTP